MFNEEPQAMLETTAGYVELSVEDGTAMRAWLSFLDQHLSE